MMDKNGLLRRIYAVGRAGSRTPDPYDKLEVQRQVRVVAHVWIYTRLWCLSRSTKCAKKRKKMPLGLARGRKCFVISYHKAGFALGKCAPGVGKVWERVPSTFPDPTSLALDD